MNQSNTPRPGKPPHRQKRPDEVRRFVGAFEWLSSFHPAPVAYEGVSYPSIENALAAAMLSDEGRRPAFLWCSPREARRLSGTIIPRAGWDRMRDDVMRDLIAQKFLAGSDLARRLLATGRIPLINENRDRDTYWGVCDDRGENRYGVLLMEWRSALVDAALRGDCAL